MLGQVVLSKAGKDRGSFYAIVLEDEEFAFIADGRLRKVEKPKRKRKTHLSFTKTVLEKDALETNGKLVNARSKFNKIDEGGN